MSASRQTSPHPLPHLKMSEEVTLPSVAEVTDLHPAAGKVVEGLHAIVNQARAAVTEVEQSRYKGPLWMDAEAEDRRALIAGEESTALADLIDAEPRRYGHATALVSTQIVRLEAARAKGAPALKKAADAAIAAITEALDDAGVLIEQGWSKRSTLKGQMAFEQAQRLLDTAERLEILQRWLSGTDKNLAKPGTVPVGLDPVARGRLNANRADQRDGYMLTWTDAMGVRPDGWKPAGSFSVA